MSRCRWYGVTLASGEAGLAGQEQTNVSLARPSGALPCIQLAKIIQCCFRKFTVCSFFVWPK